MERGNICVSGIDPETWRFVRPVYPGGINRDFVMEGATQIIRHFNLVEMEFIKYDPQHIHHNEDWIVNENFAPKYIRHLNNQEIIKVLEKMSISNLNEAIDRMDKSLFIVKARGIIRIWDEHQYGKFKVRINFVDYSRNIFEKIPVSDLLVLAKVRWMIRNGKRYSYEMMNIFNNNPFRYIRIGLTREFHGQYWKQVTALITIPDMFDGETFADYEKKLGDQV